MKGVLKFVPEGKIQKMNLERINLIMVEGVGSW